MSGNEGKSAPTQSNQVGSGAASNVGGTGNVTQTVNVAHPKLGKLTGVVIPIAAAVISAVGGAYATHQFTLARAPERTADQTETLLGIARGAIDIAKSSHASPALISKLEELSSQTQAVQANVQLLKAPPGGASLQADFWLPMNKGALLGENASFGVNGIYAPGNIRVTLNDRAQSMQSGVRIPYKTKGGKSCYVVYVGPSPDDKLHGFKTACDA